MTSIATVPVRGTTLTLACAILALGCHSSPAIATLLLYDRFEYVVNRDNATLPGSTGSAFITQGPWTNAKAVNITGSHVGRLYTTATIPGYSGPLPGTSSARVLAMESPNVAGGSDFYLQYGASESSANDNLIPANVWFQWWHYTNHYGSQLSGIENRHKFIYPCNNAYPCSTNKWLISLSANPYSTLGDGLPYGSPTSGGQAFLVQRDHGVGNISYAPAGPDNATKLGPFRADGFIPANRWTLIKVHLDTSDPSSGKFETWMRPYGGQWTKVVEWIGGVTPGFTWNGFPAGGHRAIRIPTTIGWSNTPVGGAYYYIDDFAMASREESLPTYGDLGSGPNLPAPTNLRRVN